MRYEGVSAGLSIERPAAAVVVLRLTGWDTGKFGDAAMLTGSPFVQLTAKFVQRFAELGEAMRIYSDPKAFDSALRKEIGL